VLLDLCLNTFLVEVVLIKRPSVSQPGCIEDANLREMLFILTTSVDAYTYYHTVLARKFVKSGGVGLALAVGTTSLVGIVKNVKVVVVNVVASKDISDEFQD